LAWYKPRSRRFRPASRRDIRHRPLGFGHGEAVHPDLYALFAPAGPRWPGHRLVEAAQPRPDLERAGASAPRRRRSRSEAGEASSAVLRLLVRQMRWRLPAAEQRPVEPRRAAGRRPEGSRARRHPRMNKARGTTPLAAEWNGTSWSVKDLPMRATSEDWLLDA